VSEFPAALFRRLTTLRGFWYRNAIISPNRGESGEKSGTGECAAQ